MVNILNNEISPQKSDLFSLRQLFLAMKLIFYTAPIDNQLLNRMPINWRLWKTFRFQGEHMAITETEITSFTQYFDSISDLTSSWYFPTGLRPWLRGQSDASKAPIPGVFRNSYKEHDLTNSFRQRAGNTSAGPTAHLRTVLPCG